MEDHHHHHMNNDIDNDCEDYEGCHWSIGKCTKSEVKVPRS